MRCTLLLAVLVLLVTACSESSSTPMDDLSKVAAVKSGTPTLVFVYTDG